MKEVLRKVLENYGLIYGEGGDMVNKSYVGHGHEEQKNQHRNKGSLTFKGTPCRRRTK